MIRIAAYSAISLAALGGILVLISGGIGVGIVVLVLAVLLALAFARIERYIRRDVEVV